MDTVMRYQVGNDSSVLVEIDEDTYGVEAVSRFKTASWRRDSDWSPHWVACVKPRVPR